MATHTHTQTKMRPIFFLVTLFSAYLDPAGDSRSTFLAMPLTATSLVFELSLGVSLEVVEVLDEALDLTLRLRGPGLAGGLGVSGTTSAEL